MLSEDFGTLDTAGLKQDMVPVGEERRQHGRAQYPPSKMIAATRVRVRERRCGRSGASVSNSISRCLKASDNISGLARDV